MNRDEILDRIDSSWQAFQGAIDALPADRATDRGVSGDWSVRDILGHLAFWENQAADHLENPDQQDSGRTVEEINAEEHDRIQALSFEEARSALAASHDRIVKTAQSSEALIEDAVKGDTWEHYDEHGADIRAWRARQGI